MHPKHNSRPLARRGVIRPPADANYSALAQCSTISSLANTAKIGQVSSDTIFTRMSSLGGGTFAAWLESNKKEKTHDYNDR